MKDQKLEDLLEEWEGTWERPGVKEYFQQLGRIAILLILLLILMHSCERLKGNAATTVYQTEIPDQ